MAQSRRDRSLMGSCSHPAPAAADFGCFRNAKHSLNNVAPVAWIEEALAHHTSCTQYSISECGRVPWRNKDRSLVILGSLGEASDARQDYRQAAAHRYMKDATTR